MKQFSAHIDLGTGNCTIGDAWYDRDKFSGCDTLGESALVGAGAGALAATAVGGNAATGAIIGGVGGAYCHQTNNIC